MHRDQHDNFCSELCFCPSMSFGSSCLLCVGIYVNAPDSWFPFGISKMGIGYNEGTFRLSDIDLINLIQRQVSATTIQPRSSASSSSPFHLLFSSSCSFILPFILSFLPSFIFFPSFFHSFFLSFFLRFFRSLTLFAKSHQYRFFQVIYDATYYTIPSMAWSQSPGMAMFHWNSPLDLVQFEASIAAQLAFGLGTFIYQTPGGRFTPSPQGRFLYCSRHMLHCLPVDFLLFLFCRFALSRSFFSGLADGYFIWVSVCLCVCVCVLF